MVHLLFPKLLIGGRVNSVLAWYVCWYEFYRCRGTKGSSILELIGRPNGATLAEIGKATDWQEHSIRGFLSTAAKKHGLKIESTKTEAGDRVYQTKK